MATSWTIVILGVSSILVFAGLFFVVTCGNSCNSITTVTLVSDPTCSSLQKKCDFVINNPGEACNLANVTLYQYYSTSNGYEIIDQPHGVLEHFAPNMTINANSNLDVSIPLPGSQTKGSSFYYQLEFSIGQTVFGEVTVQ